MFLSEKRKTTKPKQVIFMSEFSNKNYNSKNYDDFRPVYNEEFYKYLLNFHNKVSHGQDDQSVILDVGSGPGTAVFQMKEYYGKHFNKIIGTDLSAAMLKTAESKLNAIETLNGVDKPKVIFQKASCMDFSKAVDGKVDMVTAAQSAHWFLPFKDFLKEARNVLKPNGTLAIWGYVDPSFAEYPELDEYLLSLDYGEKFFGNYWEQPGRSIVRNLFDDQVIEEADGFYDIEVRKFSCENYRNNEFDDFPLVIKKKITIEQFKNYVYTWSSVAKRRKELNDVDGVINSYFTNLFLRVPGLSWESKVTVLWKSVYKFARRR